MIYPVVSNFWTSGGRGAFLESPGNPSDGNLNQNLNNKSAGHIWQTATRQLSEDVMGLVGKTMNKKTSWDWLGKQWTKLAIEPNKPVLFVLLTDSFIMKNYWNLFLECKQQLLPAVTGPDRFRQFWGTHAWIEIYPVECAIDHLNNRGRKQHMTPARARTQTSRFGVQRTGNQAAAPTTYAYYTRLFFVSHKATKIETRGLNA